MSAETFLRVNEPSYYHREYNNDLHQEIGENQWIATGKRVACVALPFISLYKPLSFPFSVGMGAFRVYTSVSQLVATIQTSDNAKEIALEVLQTAISVIALVGTIFAHPIGMLITTGQDLILETIALVQHLQNGDLRKVFESCISIINNALYLMLFLNGGLELAIASLAVQILTGLYHSISEFREGKYLEAGGHLLMAVVRSHQVVEKIRVLRLTHEIDMLIKFGNNPDGLSALDYACKIGDEKAVQFLLDRGASAQGAPIFYAAIGGNAKVIELLIQHGAEANPQTAPMTHCHTKASNHKRFVTLPSPLHLAALFNRSEAITCLLKHKADICNAYLENNTGIFILNEYRQVWGTPIHTAIYHGNIEAVEALAVPSIQAAETADWFSHPPLHFALSSNMSRNQNAMVRLLLEKGSNPSQRDAYGRMPIFFANGSNIEILIECGANIHTTYNGKTKLEQLIYEIEHVQKEINLDWFDKAHKEIRILLERGAVVTESMIKTTTDLEVRNLLQLYFKKS